MFQLDPQDYKGWAYGLKKAGYATNPRYPEMLIKFIEDNDLHQYTMIAINEVPVYDASKFKSDPEEKVFTDIVKNKGSSANGKDVESHVPKEKIDINGSNAIYEVEGKSLLAIATENDINLNKLLEYNDMQKDGLLEKDQIIFLEKNRKKAKRIIT
ncbi:MAG: hypothetical protein WKF59_10780 [Chitinophagaceae bacterium]